MTGVATSVLALGVAGLVYAAWTASGTGSGYAKAGSAQDLSTVDASASAAATLYPGASGDVVLKIDNPNPFPIRVTEVSQTAGGAITADSAHSTCGSDGAHPTGVTFTDQTGQAIDVPAGDSSQVTLSGAVHMSNASDDSCQGATFTIPVSLTGHSNAS